MARNLRWHSTNQSSDEKLRHPVDSVTWKQMNEKYPTFAAEERNIRLGLSTDRFNPFNMQSSKYSCWPVLLVNYNLPPNLCMKKENIMLTLLIPGPQQPGNSIDVYLEPLINDLNQLWSKGESTYDVVSNTAFTMKAMLLWTISDFPAYGNLAGCKVKGKMGCPVCGKHTDSMWLKFCRKHVYMSHRKGLPPMHRYRSKKAWFDGHAEHGRKSRILSGHDISNNLHFVNNFGNFREGRTKRKRTVSVEEDCDIEDVPVNLRQRKKMKLMRRSCQDGKKDQSSFNFLIGRKDLHPRAKGKRTYLPAAPWSLLKSEKKVFCKRLSDFKGPDGYCSNISRGVSVEEFKVSGLKSHDYHVLMQQLLPVAVRGLLPKGPRLAILRMCAFFNRLCQRVIDVEQISKMEAEVVETLCMFERFFPPSFFDIMVHLTVHLGRKAKLCGPVHFRWMYPFERHMKILKDYVRNTARPEGCIAESYLAEECMQFCSAFLKKTTNVEEKLDRNADYESQTILEGRPISAPKSINLSEMEKKTAHLAVLQNTSVVDPYVECQWAVRGNGVKVEDGYTLVNLNQSQVSINRDPYILASQAKQVFYSREDDTSYWYVVLRGPSRRYNETEEEDVNIDIGPLPSIIDMDVEIDEAHNARVDCEGIYV
ncbi:uncharacterized protein LOC106393753 [Brassica napus]|uniref:uncharacterized protein LOC106393753 n=1 Tax=Brassica napus TaxID=3708 RepID=UPI00207A78FD|nr:uncharacterized protein LOC106393753 [Brassica napus]